MPCIGLPLKPVYAKKATADAIEVLDEHGRLYSLGNLLACGRKMFFRVHITWQNCTVINLRITCGDHGTAKTLVNANLRLPQPSGEGWVTIKGPNNALLDVAQVLNNCGYSCTSRQAFFCAYVNCIA